MLAPPLCKKNCMKKVSTATVALALFVLATDQSYAQGQRSDQVVSNVVEFAGKRFSITEVSDDRGTIVLHKEWESFGKPVEARITIDGWTVPTGHSIEDVELAVWYGGGLCVAIVTHDDGVYEAHLLIFYVRNEDTHHVQAGRRKIYSSPKNAEILALNGNFQGDGIVVLVGRMVADPPTGQRFVKAGAIYVDDCPSPDVVTGSISEFSESKQVKLWDIDDLPQ